MFKHCFKPGLAQGFTMTQRGKLQHSLARPRYPWGALQPWLLTGNAHLQVASGDLAGVGGLWWSIQSLCSEIISSCCLEGAPARRGVWDSVFLPASIGLLWNCLIVSEIRAWGAWAACGCHAHNLLQGE